MNEKFEFHFHSNSDRQRAAFLRAVAPFEFFVYSFCVNKAKLTSDFLHTKDGLYNSICGMLFENARGTLDRAIVKIDKKDDKPFRLELSKYLKKKINKGEGSIQHIKSVSMENSHANNLIQMADMICGAIARRHKTGKKDADWFFNMIRHRIVSEREWPV